MIGQILGGYQIIELIGSGGMATVYKAYDPALDRLVAIKTLPHQYTYHETFRPRFEREVRAITLLEHPHILPVFGHGEDQGVAYLAMRYIEAGTLKHWLANRPIPLSRAFNLVRQIASALDYAHEQGIVHRDVKPSNILIDQRDNIYLTDFGLAKIIEDSAPGLTRTEFLGTPRYMSPEQCSDAREITPASDQYSLAVILYQMVTGQTPYDVDAPMAILNKHITRAPFALPSHLRADLPSDAEAVILKALAFEPQDRFASCGAMAHAFGAAIGEYSTHSYDTVAPMPVHDVTISPSPLTMLPDTDTISPLPIATPAPWDVPQPRPHHRKRFVWGLSVLGMLAAIGIGLLLFSTRDNNNTTAARPTNTRPVATLTPELPTLVAIVSLTPVSTRTMLPTWTLTATRPNEECEQYTVQAGDTLFRIAIEYGVTVDELIEVNNLSENPILDVGQVLIVPSDNCQTVLIPTPFPTINIKSINQTATALSNTITQTIEIAVNNAGDLQQEGVTITNLADTRNVTGWQLTDEDGHTFVFPEFRIFSNATVTIFTRSGQNTPVALYWNENTAVWQIGETLTLMDADDNVMASFVVGSE